MFRLAQRTVCRVWELAHWQIGTLAHSLALLKNGLSGAGISTLADWHISTFSRFAQEWN